MNKIINKILQEDPNAKFVFDIDGVLASYEYDDYNHGYDEDTWSEINRKGDPYQQARPFKVMQSFIALHLNNCYVASRYVDDNEKKSKARFVTRYYEIPKDRMFFVRCIEEKLEVLGKVYSMNPSTKPEHIAMIDDQSVVLDYIKNTSKFATVHISSFLE